MPRPFRFGVVTAYTQSHSAWVETARKAETLGYATLLIPDRANIGSLAPLTALATAAEATTSLHVGSYVFSNEYRHPVILAREAATLALLSEGRFELGLGAGVGEAEARQLGIDFPKAGTRVARLEETLQITRRLFAEEVVNFTGKHYTLRDVKGFTGPMQQGRPPLLVAGAGERMLKLAAREADIIAIGSKFTGRGPDPADATLEQKLTWIREAAGERFSELELSQTIYYMQISDSVSELAPLAGGPPIPKQPFTTEQAVAHLLEQRERFGFSYLQVYEGQMENFAPVIARLAGK